MADSEEIPDEKEGVYDSDELYKRYYRTSTAAGFISLKPWWEAGKIKIDIGDLAPAGGLRSSTHAWCGVIGLAVFLRSSLAGRATELYRNGELVMYGGGMMEGRPVSRICKIVPLANGAYMWKTGTFEANRTPSGAYTPRNMDHPISANAIRRTALDMTEISYLLDVGIGAYASANPGWAAQFAGGKRK